MMDFCEPRAQASRIPRAAAVLRGCVSALMASASLTRLLHSGVTARGLPCYSTSV
jgi:hypothetical protein